MGGGWGQGEMTEQLDEKRAMCEYWVGMCVMFLREKETDGGRLLSPLV